MPDLADLQAYENLPSPLQRLAEVARLNRESPGTSRLSRGLAHLQQQGGNAFFRPEEYDPAPVLEAAMLPMGGTAFSAPKGAIGSGLVDPLYHGSSKAGLGELRPSVSGALGPGVYTSTAPGVAERYAWQGVPVYQLPEKTRDVFRGHGHRSDAEWFGFKEDKARLLAAAEPEKREAISQILEKTWSNDGYPMWGQIRRLYKNDEDAAQALFKRAGFEGVSGLVDGPEILLFEGQKLK